MGQDATANLFYGVYFIGGSIEYVAGGAEDFDFDDFLDEFSGFSEQSPPFPSGREGAVIDEWRAMRSAWEARRESARVARFGLILGCEPIGYDFSGFIITAAGVEVRWGPEPFQMPTVDTAAADAALKIVTDALDAKRLPLEEWDEPTGWSAPGWYLAASYA